MGTSYKISESYGIMERCLKDILNLLEPLETDRAHRLNVLGEITSILRSQTILEDAIVKPFGSFASNLYSKWGDLDISVDFPSNATRQRPQDFLWTIMGALLRAGFARNCNVIGNARVPVLKFQSNYQDISCDISINNHIGQIKSKILLWISDIDERFHDMVLLVKEWAKAQDINNPKEGTLNSYSLCLMVIFHFQTCSPPILPPLKEIYEGNVANAITGTTAFTERRIQDECLPNIARFKSQIYRQKNKSSLSQLLVEFFHKFSDIGSISSTNAFCTYTGQMGTRYLIETHALWIEDPFEHAENTARAVSQLELNKISRAFSESYRQLSSRNVRSDRASLLASLVRPSIRSQLRGGIHIIDADDDDDAAAAAADDDDDEQEFSLDYETTVNRFRDDDDGDDDEQEFSLDYETTVNRFRDDDDDDEQEFSLDYETTVNRFRDSFTISHGLNTASSRNTISHGLNTASSRNKGTMWAAAVAAAVAATAAVVRRRRSQQ